MFQYTAIKNIVMVSLMEYSEPKQDEKSTSSFKNMTGPKSVSSELYKLIFISRLLLQHCHITSQLKEVETKVIKTCREQNFRF
jgi:hypothetical protein